jgi:hypothetical protein
MTKMTEQTTEKPLVEQIQDTQTLLETLSAEQADLGKKMAIAADDADSASLISLKHRVNDLPIELIATQIRLERLYLERDELRLPAFQSEAQKLAEIVTEKLKMLADAQTQFNFASGNQSSAASDVSETKMAISERRRVIESLLAQARNVKIAPASLQMHGGG